MTKLFAFVLLMLVASSSALSTRNSNKIGQRSFARRCISNDDKNVISSMNVVKKDDINGVSVAALATAAITLSMPFSVEAAVDATSAIPSALAAYGHYLGLVLVAASLTVERLLIKPNMSQDDEIKVIVADTVYGIAGLLVLVSGYFRLTAYGKGLDFYLHEPIFWVKMTLFAIMGSSSFFPTIKLVQRAIDLQNVKDGKKDASSIKPISEKLANRITKVVNGELLALGSIPLAATLMSRGVIYSDDFPWQVGAVPVALSVVGLGFKYVKEALEWTEDEN